MFVLLGLIPEADQEATVAPDPVPVLGQFQDLVPAVTLLNREKGGPLGEWFLMM